MRILWVATKPPWPPRDGGRWLQLLTLEALSAAGHEVTLVAPSLAAAGAKATALAAERLAACCRPHLVPHRLRPPLVDLALALVRRQPYTLARHRSASVRREVAALAAAGGFDVVHAEQLQALPQATAARRPVVLRTQNVESDLWAAAGRGSWPGSWPGSWSDPLWRIEARRLAAWEGQAVRQAAATVALTVPDAERLRQLAHRTEGGSRVEVVPAPFPPVLPAAAQPLAGDPAVVLFGSAGWAPNRDQVDWFARRCWPQVRAALPAALLHVFGGDPPTGEGIVGHAAPEDSREVFAPGSILVVPLRIASGVRMKILEAWARGVPVVATSDGAAGLAAAGGRELLLASDGPTFATALARLRREPQLAATLVAAGRQALAARHDPALAAAALEQVYRSIGPRPDPSLRSG